MRAKEELPMKSLHVLQALIAGWFALTCAGGSSRAQTPAGDPAPASGGPVDPALIEDLVIQIWRVTSLHHIAKSNLEG